MVICNSDITDDWVLDTAFRLNVCGLGLLFWYDITSISRLCKPCHTETSYCTANGANIYDWWEITFFYVQFANANSSQHACIITSCDFVLPYCVMGLGHPCYTSLEPINHLKLESLLIVLLETQFITMTSSNGNIFRVTGHLGGEFTGPRWIPHTKASDAELWCFLWSASE